MRPATAKKERTLPDPLPKLLTPPLAALLMGLDEDEVSGWVYREVDPLPSVPYGKSGKRRKVIVAEIDEWLERQAKKGVRA